MSSKDLQIRSALPSSVEFTNAPLRLRIASVLREAILDGDLRPGTPLVETALAERLEVSRAPVREAIRILAEEGLIETAPYRGSRVRPIERRDVEEVYELRGLHETFAVARIIERSDACDLSELEATCGRMSEHASRGDMRAVSAEDDRFHRLLIEAADHRLLLSIWTQLALRARQIMSLRNLQLKDPQQVATNHAGIVDALKARRLETALERVREHVREGTMLVVDGWGEGEESS